MESKIQIIESNPLNILNTINSTINVTQLSEKETSFSKKATFKVDEIIEQCKDKNGIELLNFRCGVMHEKKRNMLELLYKELGKDYLIAMLEKTLNIENSGGLIKGKCSYSKKNEVIKINENIPIAKNMNEKKSTGGIFFALIKKNPETKGILNKASKLDWKQSRQRKKVYKLLDKLNI